MFIGREREMDFLNGEYESEGASLVVLYGRRRIGKTALLVEFCRGRRHVFYSCNEYTDREQLDSFSRAFMLPGADAGGTGEPGRFSSWERAFSYLAAYDGEEKCVFVIDEFPYMVKGNRSIPSIIQNLWDHVLCEKNIMLILCGSSMSFMENEVLGAKNPLYGRTTGTMRLGPLRCRDAVRFFPDFTDEDKALSYAALGGNPYYLGQFDPSLSFEENVKRKLLRPGGRMFDEPELMLRQELREPAVYVALIQAIADGYNRFSEICQAAHLDGAKAISYLRNLIELGLVRTELPAFSSGRDALRTSSCGYALSDNYFRFYYRFIYPNKSDLEEGNAVRVWDRRIKDRLHDFAARPFEDMCMEYMNALSAADSLPVPVGTFDRWWGKVKRKTADGRYESTPEEIDMAAKAYDGEAYIVGECKFSSDPFDEGQLARLREKTGAAFGDAYYYLFSLGGFTDGVREEAAHDPRVRLVDLADVLSSHPAGGPD